jgi:hypothetical protein
MSALSDRLAERATELGRPVEEVVRHHVLEGLLRRLARTASAGDFVLRGSMLTRAWVAPRVRVVQDLDFVGTFPHDVGETIRRFSSLLAVGGIEDDVCLDPLLRGRGIWLNSAFPGVRLFLRAGLGWADQALQVDVGFNDPLIPPPHLLPYPTLLPGEAAEVWAVRPETAFAWKLHGLAEMGPHGWRPKDLYDLYLLVENVALDTADLVPAIEAAFVSRGYALTDAAVFRKPDWWGLKSARVKWSAYRLAEDTLDIPDDLRAVVQRVGERLQPALLLLGVAGERTGDQP